MSTTQVEVSVREEVRRGAALLDREMPGWDEQVDLTRLDICDFCNCVVGQVFGDYWDGLDELGVNSESEFGFADRRGGSDASYARLTEEWRDLIASRR